MNRTNLTPQAQAALEAARVGQGAYVLELLEAALHARGQALPPEIREAVDRPGCHLVELRDRDIWRPLDSRERAEVALLRAAYELTGGARPIDAEDLVNAAFHMDPRLAAWSHGEPLRPARLPGHLSGRPPVVEGASDLTRLAPFPVAGRDAEVAALLVRLARSENPGAVLVGPPRSGRYSTVLRLANVLAGHDAEAFVVPASLQGCRLVEAESMNGVKLGKLVDQALRERDILLLTGGDPHWIVNQLPRDKRQALRFILLMTEQQYKTTCDLPDGGFSYLGAPIRLSEPTLGQIREMVEAQLDRLKQHHGSDAGIGIVQTVVAWCDEHRCQLPASAVEVLDEAFATCTEPCLTAEHVLSVLVKTRRQDAEAADRWYFNAHWSRRPPVKPEPVEPES